MKNRVEVEVRTLISFPEYKKLSQKLKRIAKFEKEIREETIYLGSERLRIRKDQKACYLIFKFGKIHQDSRREIEIEFKRKDFEKLKEVFKNLGFPIIAKWKRKRKVFNWGKTKVFLDDTKGYGKIIELERITDKKNRKKVLEELKDKLQILGIKKITPKEVFDKKFKEYLKNWKKLL